jgi:hypothetical protein
VGKLSWLEGEVLGAATPSGVALAFRRETLALSPAALCDDVHLAVAAGTSGRRVKLAWHSVAFESRSADTAAGLLALRRRRGLAFRGELARARAAGGASRGFRLVRAVRMLLFDVVPWALLGLALLGLGLTAAGSHRLTAAVALAFAAPLAGFAAAAALERRPPAGALPLRGLGGRLFAPLRWAALSLVALVTLRFRVGPSGEAL